MGIRDFLWEYPLYVTSLVRRFSLFFTLLSGLLLGVVVVLILAGSVQSGISSRVFGDTLRYGVIGNLEVINPLEVSPSDAEQMAIKLLYNGLVTIDETGKIYPELADTWAISPDGRTYTFFLKKGIKWHDGYELTAKDVATTYELVKSGDTETVIGAIAKDVEVQIVGMYEVSFSLKQVNAAFLELAAIPIIPEHVYANINYSRLVELGDSLSPVGTGPYKYVRKSDSTVVFVRNNEYFKGIPQIRELTMTLFPNYAVAEESLLAGKIHALAPIDSRTVARLQTVGSVTNRLQVAVFTQANNHRVLLFNMQENGAAFAKELRIRQAIAQSINKKEITSLVSGASEAYGPYDKSSYAYDATVETLLPYSPTEAAALLEQEGWKYAYSGALYRTKADTELKVTLVYLDNEVNRQVASQLREQLERVGINLALQGVTSDQLVQNTLPKKEFELLLFEIHTGSDPDQYGLWHSSQTVFPGLNLGGYNSVTVDALMEKGRLQTNRDKRLEIYQQFQSELVKDAVVIFLYHPAYFEVNFDIIERKLPTTIVGPSDRFSQIHTWKLMPGWRNWQTR